MSSLGLRGALVERVPFLALSPPSPLGPRRVLHESIPVAGLVLLWTVLSWVTFEPRVAWAVRTTGAVAALGYVVVRGFRLGADATPLVTGDPASVLGQGVRLAVAPTAWFLVAVLIPVVEGLWDSLGLFGLFVSPANDLVRVCALTGLGTALLLVIVGGVAAVDSSGSSSTPTSPRD